MNQILLDSDQSHLKLRSIQTNDFQTSDKANTMRFVIATLLDLEFVIDKADLVLGIVSATKLSGYMLKMPVSVSPRSNKNMVVRANAQYNITPVTDPEETLPAILCGAIQIHVPDSSGYRLFNPLGVMCRGASPFFCHQSAFCIFSRVEAER